MLAAAGAPAHLAEGHRQLQAVPEAAAALITVTQQRSVCQPQPSSPCRSAPPAPGCSGNHRYFTLHCLNLKPWACTLLCTRLTVPTNLTLPKRTASSRLFWKCGSCCGSTSGAWPAALMCALSHSMACSKAMCNRDGHRECPTQQCTTQLAQPHACAYRHLPCMLHSIAFAGQLNVQGCIVQHTQRTPISWLLGDDCTQRNTPVRRGRSRAASSRHAESPVHSARSGHRWAGPGPATSAAPTHCS